ncbi:MarR family winged helix-turn-helix transcriptional regulator [Paraglaciecola arctica]|nr:MarR family transcriptional regulator [Paraglaciecola arctica]
MTESHIIKLMKDEKQISELGGRSQSHEAALVAINNHPNETIDVLSKVLGLSHSGAVRLINTLEKENLVMRHKSARDARAIVLCTTNAGSERVQKILDSRERVTAQMLKSFDDRQKQDFLRLLKVAMSNLTQEQIEARRICRLCNEGVCRKSGCPVENSVK